jgi:RNA polymerase sigma-70 factor (ECF subfamily)
MPNRDANAAVDLLFAEWYRPLLRYAVRLTGSLAGAEDFVQEAFLSYYRALAENRPVSCPKAYTMAAVRHQAQRAWAQRRSGRVPGSIDDLPDALILTSDEERTIIWDDLQRLIAELTPREVEVLLLRSESLTYREIGQELGIATTSVGTLLARALKKLQGLSGTCAPESPALGRQHSTRSAQPADAGAPQGKEDPRQ